MAQSSWPSPGTSRVVSDLQYEQLVAAQHVDGQIGSPSDTALVFATGDGRQVFVRAGRFAQLRGHGWTSGATDVTLTIGANTSGSTRTDLVVLGLDRSTWNVTAYVKAGTPGSGAPALQTDPGGPGTGIYEMPLAEVTVLNGASVISAGQVKPRAWWTRPDGYASNGTDTRPPNPVTGEVLWESSTKYVWNGSIWERTSNPMAPAQTSQTTTYSGTSGSSGIAGDSVWHRFGATTWPVLSFTVPASGRFYVTVGGFVENRLAASSVIVMSYGMSGGGTTSTISDTVLGPRGISARNGRVCASRRVLYSGMTPGATVTVTPYYLSTVVSPDREVTSLRDGNLLMEPA